MKITVYNVSNEEVGFIDVPDEIFNAKWNPVLVHDMAVSLAANQRKPWAHSKDRSEVRGGGKKPWRQKGTGRARAGSRRSPLWRGGGVTFGPLKEKNYTKKINKKMKRAALFSVLSRKIQDGEIKVVNEIVLSEPKTKIIAEILKKTLNRDSKAKKPVSVLIVPQNGARKVLLAGRNLPKTSIIYPKKISLINCLANKWILFEKKAVEEFAEHCAPKKVSG